MLPHAVAMSRRIVAKWAHFATELRCGAAEAGFVGVKETGIATIPVEIAPSPGASVAKWEVFATV